MKNTRSYPKRQNFAEGGEANPSTEAVKKLVADLGLDKGVKELQEKKKTLAVTNAVNELNNKNDPNPWMTNNKMLQMDALLGKGFAKGGIVKKGK